MFCFALLFLVSDSTCITPILNVCSSTTSQLSASSTTPTKSYATAYLTPRSSLTSSTLDDSTSADFYSLAPDSEEFNETVTNQATNSIYDTCIGVSTSVGNRILDATRSIRLLNATRSVQQRLRPFRSYGKLLNKITKLQQLSIVRAVQINIKSGNHQNETKGCACEDGHFDGNCLKSFMEMSVQAPEYRSNNTQMMTSTPVVTKDVYDQNIFNVARIKKVELHELAPKVPEFHGKLQLIQFFFCVYAYKFEIILFLNSVLHYSS